MVATEKIKPKIILYGNSDELEVVNRHQYLGAWISNKGDPDE